MKQKEFDLRGDELGLLREAWQAHKQRVSELPGLGDEKLQQLFADYCKEHSEVPPLTTRRSQRWQQVLTALFCLAAAVCCAVRCVRMWDDVPFRLLLGVAAVGCLLCAVWSVQPHLWFLFGLKQREQFETLCADGRLSPVGYALRSVFPLGVAAFAILGIGTYMPIGDGYSMATVSYNRLAAIENVNYIITHLV